MEPFIEGPMGLESRTGARCVLDVVIPEGGRPRLVALRVEEVDRQGIDGALLREIAGEVRGMTDRAAGLLRVNYALQHGGQDFDIEDYLTQHQLPDGGTYVHVDVERIEADQSKAMRRRRTYNPDDSHREVARVYLESEAEGLPVQQSVADHFRISVSAAGKRIHEARRRGFLPAAPKRGGKS